MFGVIAAVIFAIAAVVGISSYAKNHPRPEGRTTAVGWGAFWFSVVGGLLLGVAILLSFIGPESPGPVGQFLNPFPWSMGLLFAGAALAVVALVRNDRRWPTWIATAIGGLGAAFWLVFFVGELLFPH